MIVHKRTFMEVFRMEITIDFIWLSIAAMLVFFMQAGFAMLESGLARSKNAANIIMKNMVDMGVGAITYLIIGWGFMYGEMKFGLIGTSQFFLNTADDSIYRDWMYQAVFAATATTIVSGALSERTKFMGYIIVSAIISAFIYPIAGSWTWNNGWLASLGFHDFAGAAVVHLLGATLALVGAIILGPRIGKYRTRKDGSTETIAIPGHNIPLACLGTFILWFGWYGFNAGSTLSGNDHAISLIMVNTTLGASAGLLSALFYSWAVYGKPDTPITIGGTLGGLVSITAGCYVISPMEAIIIGLVGGIVVTIVLSFIENKLKIDDPVGAFAVHGAGGMWAVLAVGIFGDLDKIGSGNSRIEQIGIQFLGMTVYFIWPLITGLIVFGLLKKFNLLRVSREHEFMGLDEAEHGNDAYSGFQVFYNS